MHLPTVETLITFHSELVELDFAVLSNLMGHEPDSMRSLNHLTASGRIAPIRCSEWTLSTGEHVDNSVDDGVRRLFALFEKSNLDAAKALSCSRGYEISVISRVRIRDWDDRPFVELGALSIERLQHLGAGWGLDWIDLSR